MGLFKKDTTHQLNSHSTKVFVEKSIKELPELEETLNTLSNKKEELESQIASVKKFTVPFKTDQHSKNYPSFFSKYKLNRWSDYQRDLYCNWADASNGKNCIHYYVNFYSYIGALIFYFIGLGILLTNEINAIFDMSPLVFIPFTYLIFEIIIGVISTYYWIIRPNNINRRIFKKELNQVNSNLKIITNDITLKKNIIQQYKMVQTEPEEEYANMKKDTKEQLKKIIKDSRTQVLAYIDGSYYDRYSTILDKAERLLYSTENKGTSFTEISKIYNIYLNELNSILLRSHTDDKSNSIIELFNAFESFLDRKIEKFKNMSAVELDRDINALTNAIKEEEDLQ